MPKPAGGGKSRWPAGNRTDLPSLWGWPMTVEAEVLVVEDEPDLADLYAAWLKNAYAVRTAYSGEEALDKLDESIDVVFLDRRMPGISGDAVLEEIQERHFECRVSMVTAVEPDYDIVEMGFDDYLVKPATKEELTKTVERLLTRSNYNDKLDEYASLVSKKTALEMEKSHAELNSSEEFQKLEARIDQLKEHVDPIVQDFDQEDVAAVLRDLPMSS